MSSRSFLGSRGGGDCEALGGGKACANAPW